jgi:hypothetical protein
MKHPNKLEGYNGTLEDLAKAIGNMSYDKTAEFIEDLAKDIGRQANEDCKKGRIKLSSKLYRTAKKLYQSKKSMEDVWKICEPYMKNEIPNF